MNKSYEFWEHSTKEDVANSVGKSTADALTVAQAYALLKACEDANYIMATKTDGDGDYSVSNACGVAQSHAYSFVSVFDMTDASSVTHKMLMMRNYQGTTAYSST